jgi:hypothetical protein
MAKSLRMNIRFLLIPALALGLVACGGEHRPQQTPQVPWHPASAKLIKYVTNADGSLTRAQLEAGLRRDFAVADVKKTGCLDADETRAVNAQRWAEDQSTTTPLMDFKGKGCIDFDEFAAAPRSEFDALDRNSDGVLSKQELNPYAPQKKDDGSGDAQGGHHHGHHGGGSDSN